MQGSCRVLATGVSRVTCISRASRMLCWQPACRLIGLVHKQREEHEALGRLRQVGLLGRGRFQLLIEQRCEPSRATFLAA